MKRIARYSLLALCLLPTLALALWLLAASSQLSVAHAAAPVLTTTPSPTVSPTVTPSPTATPSATPVFTATLDVSPDRQVLAVGETLSVTLTLMVSEGCQYPVMDAQLTQSGTSAPNFTYVDPITDTVGPPVAMPFTFLLQATTPGEVTLNGRLYGERYCGDFWAFTYVNGDSPLIEIVDSSYWIDLPWVGAGDQGGPSRRR